MKDVIWKLRVLWMLVLDPYHHWKQEIWPQDPDSYQCCSGGTDCNSICGCKGMTIRECYSQSTNLQGG